MFSKKFLYIQIPLIIVAAVLLFAYLRKSSNITFSPTIAQSLPVVVKPLPVLGSVADFQLKSSDAQDVSLIDLKGKVWVADFMFTSCGSICPMMTKNMNILHRSFHDNVDVKLVSISVNPEGDSPEVMGAYARKYRIDTHQWYFLTGTRDAITKLVIESFKLGDIKEPIFHSSYFALVDRSANIRGYYDGTDVSAIKRISQDLTQLLKEK